VDNRTRGGRGKADGGGIAPALLRVEEEDDGSAVLLGMIGNGRTNGGGGGREALECTGVDARVVSNALECTGVVARDSPSGSTTCGSTSVSGEMTVVASLIISVVAFTPTAAASALPSLLGDVNSVPIISPTNALPSLDSRVAREGEEWL